MPPQPQHAATNIPLYYRIFFTWIDPIICVWGASMDFFDPRLVLSAHIPDPTVTLGSAMILKQRGGAMLNFGFNSAVLLRYTYDINIWTFVQIADFIVDVAVFWGIYDALEAQGRLNAGTWRKEDWGSIVITAVATITRLAFMAGIGFKKAPKTNKRL